MRRRVTWLLVPLAWALACGGRFEQTVGGDGDAGGSFTGQGGSGQPKAGSASRAGSTGQAAATGRGGSAPSGSGAATASGGAPIGAGGFATAGTLVVGTAGTFVGTAGTFVGTAGTFIGTAGSSGCACDPIGCASPYMAVPNADGCCYHCELDIKTCEGQRQAYVAYRQQLLDKYGTYMCGSNADCTIYYDKNACGATACGFPIATAMWENLDRNLSSYAQMACSPNCPTGPVPPCDPSPGPECFKGYCD